MGVVEQMMANPGAFVGRMTQPEPPRPEDPPVQPEEAFAALLESSVHGLTLVKQRHDAATSALGLLRPILKQLGALVKLVAWVPGQAGQVSLLLRAARAALRWEVLHAGDREREVERAFTSLAACEVLLARLAESLIRAAQSKERQTKQARHPTNPTNTAKSTIPRAPPRRKRRR